MGDDLGDSGTTMRTRHHLQPRFVPVADLDDETLQRLEAIRYRAMRSLVGRSEEADLERYRAVIHEYQTACLFIDEKGGVEGSLLINFRPHEVQGRSFMWVQTEQGYIEAEYRGLHAIVDAWVRFMVPLQVRHPRLPVYYLAPLFPPSWLDVTDQLAGAMLWGEDGLPAWEQAVVEYLLPELAGDHEILREQRLIQLAVASDTHAPPKFHSQDHRVAFERYEARAPEWRKGRVPVFIARVRKRDLARGVVGDAYFQARQRLGAARA